MTTIFAAAGSAILVLLAGSLPWAGFGRFSGLGGWNLRVGTSVPWAIFPMAIYLWAYFSFIGGRWGASGAEGRRRNLLANRPLRERLACRAARRCARMSARFWRS